MKWLNELKLNINAFSILIGFIFSLKFRLFAFTFTWKEDAVKTLSVNSKALFGLLRRDFSLKKSENLSSKYGTRKPTGRPEKLSPQFKRRIVCEVKMKTSSTSKILKSLVDFPCSDRTTRRHLNNEKINLGQCAS